MTEKVNGITVFTVNYKESDKILTLFTLEKGKIAANARGVRRVNAKSRQIGEPFCFAEIMLAEKAGRHTVAEVEVIDTFYPIRTDVKKYYAGSCALEFTNAFTQEGLVDTEYFVRLLDFLKDLAYGDGDPKTLLAKFLFDAINGGGYGLRLAGCGRCGEEIKERVFLSLKEGYCVCDGCRKTGEREFSFATYSYLLKVVAGEDADGDREETKNNALKVVAYYVFNAAGVDLKCIRELIAIG